MTNIFTFIKKKLSGFFIFGNLRRPVYPLKLNILYWKEDDGQDNVGDLLSKIIVERTIDYLELKRNIRFGFRRLCAVGSVMSFVGSGKTTIWGSGLMTAESVKAIKDRVKNAVLDIRAVRGPLTHKTLIEAGVNSLSDISSIPYGDPAILMPLYYVPSIKKVKGKILIIPHHSRIDRYKDKYANVIDTYTSDWEGFIDEIASSEKVISSSLHGIILAESYGIPAIMLNDYPGSRFKYDDYYQSTGRSDYPIVDVVEDGYSVDGDINRNLEVMQKRLLDSFPKDIV